ncbi:glycosyltransferase [soil metagenome]
MNRNLPLVSVIIPCYNHAHFLPDAISSVFNQSYKNVEIIIIDDGSTDNTQKVSASFKNVKYHFHKNRGLPASRNAGFSVSKGEYVIFLDADDWLYPVAIEINLDYLLKNTSLAFVSGAYDNVFTNPDRIIECKKELTHNQYVHLLNRNYIGVPAAVMYSRDVLEKFQFDEDLKSCEDYDLYLRIARKYPVFHHNFKIAAYRKHDSNMSLNFDRMLNTALEVLKRQKSFLNTDEEMKAYQSGFVFWKKYYSRKVYEGLLFRELPLSEKHLSFLWKHNKMFLVKILLRYPFLNKY